MIQHHTLRRTEALPQAVSRLSKLIKFVASLAFALPALAAAANDAALPTLCKEGEAVLFNCLNKQKIASLCVSHGAFNESDLVKYRFGTASRIELEYPRGNNGSHKLFLFSSTGHSGGSESHIKFVNGRFTYLLYDKMIRTGFPGDPGNSDGTNNPSMSGGVIVLKKGSKASRLSCRNNVSISSVAYQSLEKEDFQDGLTD
ncbi:MAG: hypothetical protein HY836_03350 [Aquabacterium sp.]|nr:hypothetical protein [Aquabacterium sp.]